jgi:hypothetical protein
MLTGSVAGSPTLLTNLLDTARASIEESSKMEESNLFFGRLDLPSVRDVNVLVGSFEPIGYKIGADGRGLSDMKAQPNGKVQADLGPNSQGQSLFPIL